MIFLLLLTPSLVLCDANTTVASEEAPSTASSLMDMQKKINDLWLSLLYPQLYDDIITANRTAYACCVAKPSSKLEDSKPRVTGLVLFKQFYPHGKLAALFDLAGFPTETGTSVRAIHIHQYGDLSDGCDSAGGHYNPWKVNHPHHPGDFGNFYPKGGNVQKLKSNLRATLFGPQTVLGRSVVIHEQEDDLGKGNNEASLAHGNAGPRLACCVIGTCKKELWDKHLPKVTAKRKKRVIKTGVA
ncbi:extracellular superoxide dismutase [Cu-Zn] [Ahaetulla prasina]|uniref:extracellular superoxide dismutase [Cu-Zn] n=1 Tax=Ahaetulla prasina TaxID=499056 RepID=UPI00264876F5|nr:extracellular superoxide dismutase [Cu-Zn] [Ahaetulla prasina]XP_058048984.1 extracellular superoxide dismutase [Cu-Zn] [Ahaetulla prasina]